MSNHCTFIYAKANGLSTLAESYIGTELRTTDVTLKFAEICHSPLLQ